MFLLVPAYPGCPGSKAVKRSLLLLLLLYTLYKFTFIIIIIVNLLSSKWSLHKFACVCVDRYKISLLKPSVKALMVSTRTSMRMDSRGFLSMQYMIRLDDGQICFAEYFVSHRFIHIVSTVVTAVCGMLLCLFSKPILHLSILAFWTNKGAMPLQLITIGSMSVGALLQATSRVPRWWIGERPPDMAASCDIYK